MFYNDMALCNEGSGAVVLDAAVGRSHGRGTRHKKATDSSEPRPDHHGRFSRCGRLVVHRTRAPLSEPVARRISREPIEIPEHLRRTVTRRRATTSPAGSSSSRSGRSSLLASPNSSTNCAPLHLLAARLFGVPGPDAHRSGINDGRDIHNTDTTCLRAGQQAMSAGSMSVVVRRIRPGDASPGGAGRPTECIRVDIRTLSSPRTRDLGVENVSEISGRSRGDVPRMA